MESGSAIANHVLQSHVFSLLEDMPDVIYMVDLDMNLTYCNKACLQVCRDYFGHDLSIGENLAKLFKKKDSQKLLKLLELIKSSTSVKFDDRITKRGVDTYFEVQVNPVYNETNTHIGVSVIAKNITVAKNAMQDMQSSEEKYRMLFFASPSPMWIYEMDTYQIMDVNDSVLSSYGYTREEMLKMNIMDLRPAEDRQSLEEIIKYYKLTKGPIHFGVWRHIKKDGSIIHVEKTGHSILFNGKPCMIEICNNISEKLLIERKLQLSNERYGFVTKATFDAIWDLNLVDDDLYWGEGFERLFGYKTENNKGDIVGWYEHIHGDDRQRVLQSINTLIKSKNSNWVEEYRFKKADGVMAYVRNKGIVIRDKKGKAIRMIGAMQDITDQKREEQQLKIFKSVITNSSDAVLITEAEPINNPGPRIIYVNSAFTKMTGYEREEVLGKTPRILQGPESDRAELDRLRDALEAWQPCEIEIVNYKKNGEKFWSNISIVPVADSKGFFTHWISIQKNITERKRAEKEKELFYELLQVISGNKHLEVAMSIVIQKISEYLGFSYAEAWLINIDESKMLYKANWAKDDTAALFRKNKPLESVQKGKGMMGEAWKQKSSIYYDNIQTSNFLAKENALLAGLESVLVMPIFLNEKVIGFFNFFLDKPFYHEQLYSELMDKISKQIGADIQKSRAEDELNRFFQMSPDLLCIVGFDGYFKKINLAVCNLLGYTEAEIMERKIEEFVFHPDKDEVLQKRSEIILGESLYGFENRYITKKGDVKWLSWTSVPIEEEGVIFAVAKDITEKKKMDLERENILESISDCFYALDNQLNFTYVNSPAQKLLRRSADELIGKNIFDIYGFLKEGLFYENFQKSLEFKQPVHFEIYFDQFSSWYEESFYPTDDGLSIFFRSINDRKQVEQEIQAAFEEKNSILESITDGFLTLDRDWVVTYWNKESERMMKVKREDIVGKHLYDVFPEAKTDVFFKTYTNAMHEGIAIHEEEFFKPLNLFLEVNAYPSERGLSVYFKDITEAKRLLALEQLEKEVLEKNALTDVTLERIITFYLTEIEKLHPLMTCSVLRLEEGKLYNWSAPNLPEPYISKIEGIEIGPNKGSCGTAAYLKQKVIVSDIANDQRWMLFWDLAKEYGFKACWSYPILNNQGQVLGTFAIYYGTVKNPTAEEEKTILRAVNILNVIIENKQFEKEILEINERYNLVSKATNDIIWDWNIRNSEVFRTGDGLKVLIDETVSELSPSHGSWIDRIHPEDVSLVIKKMNHFLYETAELYWSDSYRFLKSDGSYAYLNEKGYLTRNEKLEPIRMIGACRDITLQKETELILKSLNEKLEKRAEQLVNSNLELERFAYVASHDLQEPLRMVSSFLQLLQKKYESQLDETGNKYIHLAVDGADRMKRLISDLLQFSRVSSTAIALQPVDTNEVVEELKNLFKNKLFESGGVIHSSNLPVIMADKTPITQLLQNLIGNALKYRSEAPPEIWVDYKEEADEYIFSIKDNGLGIDPKFFEKIFVIFQRLHNKNEYSGTGIGLAICKKIVDRFNGRIWVASEPGKGSTFSFSFPK
jgi:PAS domain S-box-containing protein